jgi:protein TonB
MSPPPRSLTFVVSTSLLTASLSLLGCDEPKEAVNPGPVDKAPEDKGDNEDHVNVGPETPPQPEVPPPPPEPIHVNEGPEPVPEPQPIKTNPGPEVETPPPSAPEPKRVNTRPEP